MHLLLLLLTQTGPAEQALDRYVAYRRSTPSVEVRFTANAGGTDINGEAFIDGTRRLYYRLQGKELDYVAALTPKSILELDRTSGTYDEHDGYPTVRLMESRITGADQLFPGWLYVSDLRRLVPPKTSFLLDGKETVNGVTGDLIHASYSGDYGINGRLDAVVDDKGRVLRMHRISRGPTGGSEYTWKFSSVQPLSPSASSKFGLTLPVGYTPFALPRKFGQMEVGETFPTSGWTATKGEKLDLKTTLGATGGLVMLISENSEPSQRALAAVPRLRKILPVVVLSDTKRPVSGAEGYDATGTNVAAIHAPGSPFFARIDGSGKIVDLWMGFDPHKVDQFETELRNAIAGKE